MRLCFNGFCLGHQRPPTAVEQCSQTTIALGTSENSNIKVTSLQGTLFSKDCRFENVEMIAQEDSNFKNNMNHPSDLEEGELSRVNLEDNRNNNTLPLSNMELIKIELFNTTANVISSECNDIRMDDTELEITPKEKDLTKVIELKNLKIKELEELLNNKNDEIANLRSHLDKFQSVFPFSRKTGGAIGRKIGQTQRQRAQGISAEPQQNSMHDLLNVSFPKYEKQDR